MRLRAEFVVTSFDFLTGVLEARRDGSTERLVVPVPEWRDRAWRRGDRVVVVMEVRGAHEGD